MRGNALTSHRLLMRIAFAAGNVFAWVFAFRALYLASGHTEAALFAVAALYTLMQAIIFFVTPLSGAGLRHGMRRALAYGTLLAALAFSSFSVAFAPQVSAEFAFAAVTTFIILMGIHRALYWVPYHTEVAREGSSQITRLQEYVIALVPLAAGLIIETYWLGPGLLLSVAALITLTALVPLIRFPESYEHFQWDFLGTFNALFSPFNRSFLALAIFDGIQGAALLLAWPLAVFIIIGQSFLGLGFILTITLLVAPFGRRVVRKAVERYRLHNSTPIMATIAFSSWIVRLVAGSPLYILLADVYYHSGASPRRFSIDAHAFEQSADDAHYVDEYTALKEMGMSLGRILACIILMLGLYFTSAAVAFAALIIVTAVASVYSVVIARKLARAV